MHDLVLPVTGAWTCEDQDLRVVVRRGVSDGTAARICGWVAGP